MKCVTKWLTILMLLGLWHNNTFGADAPPASCVEKRLLEIITKWRQNDKLPFPLPSLGVIDVPSFEGQYAEFGVHMTYYTGEMKLSGVNNFVVKELLASVNNTLKASGTAYFPLLTLTADNYTVDGRAYVFYSLKGSGSMFVAFHNVTLMFGIKLSPSGEGTKVKDLQLDFSFDSIKIDLSNSSWPINKVLNSEAPNVIETHHKIILDTATQGLTHALNRKLMTVAHTQISRTFICSKQ